MKNLIILSLLGLFFTACKKEKYHGYQSFWFDYMTSYDLMEFTDVSTLTLYVDGEFVSTVDVSEYKTSAPECKEGQFLYTDKMYRNESAEHSYKIVDQNNTVFWEGKFNTEESDCNLVWLGY
ncbi:hypothetical protein D3C87_24260 [compost metagenome]